MPPLGEACPYIKFVNIYLLALKKEQWHCEFLFKYYSTASKKPKNKWIKLMNGKQIIWLENCVDDFSLSLLVVTK